jgi:threonine dehydratase
VIHRLVDDILLVDEHEIQSATRMLAETAGLVAEPSGAVTLAALKRHRERFQGDSVVAVISGGNIEMSRCQLGRLPSD